MPILPQPSQLINCNDLSSCIQATYNFLFAIFLALSFLWFLYGAFQYLLSGAKIYSKDEGKNKMKNAIISLVIVLVIPIILNMINPGIFNAELYIPKIDVRMPVIVSLAEVENSEKELTDEQINSAPNKISGSASIRTREAPSDWERSWNWKKIFADQPLVAIRTADNDNGTEYVNPALRDIIISLDKKWMYATCPIFGDCPYLLKVTDGYSPGDHASSAHTKYGTAIDIVITDRRGKIVDPSEEIWDTAIKVANQAGFSVLDERKKAGSSYWSGAHLHLWVNVSSL
jgi:hypothetical protein